MKLEDIFALPEIDKQIAELKERETEAPDIKKIKAQWNPEDHAVMDTIKRPDKDIKKDDGVTHDRYEKVGRIPFAFQKLIVNRAVSFLFGNPIVLQYDMTKAEYKPFVEAIQKVLKINKELSSNRKAGRILMTATEVAEVWYTEENQNELYGFASKWKLKHSVFDPLKGDTLFPLFDELGDMVAFSRGYVTKEDGKEIEHFDTYTKDRLIKYAINPVSNKWEVKEDEVNILGKIPIVYCTQELPEWEIVQRLIERLELLASNFADTNDYHSSPTIMVEGEIDGFAKKGEQGKILQATSGSKAYYLSWDRAPDAIKFEKEMLIEMIYTLTQTPNITFDNIKGLGAISGVALELLFLDSHLKVEDKKEIIVDYLNRRISIIKAFLAQMNGSFKTLAEKVDIDCEVIPYLVPDKKSNLEMVLLANGNKPVISKKTAITMAGLSENVEVEFAQITKEEEEANLTDIGNPTV